MPGGDQTGPMGMGPQTGRSAGYCAGYNPASGRGMGFGRGRGVCRGLGRGLGRGFGRGLQNMAYASGLPNRNAALYQRPDPEMEKQALKNQAESLQVELDFIKKRLTEIETRTTA